MSKFEKLCDEYRENKRLIEELSDMNDHLKADIIELMDGADKKTEGSTKACYTRVRKESFDKNTFRLEHRQLYQKYVKQSSYRRFSVV